MRLIIRFREKARSRFFIQHKMIKLKQYEPISIFTYSRLQRREKNRQDFAKDQRIFVVAKLYL